MYIPHLIISSHCNPTFLSVMYFDNMNAYVGIEGFLTKSGFILKELCIFYDDERFDHYIFKEPTWTWGLTNRDLDTIHYISSRLNGLHLQDGSIPYKAINEILGCIRYYQIYTFSNLAVETLREYLPDTEKIKNIQDLGFEMPKHLPNPHCFRSHSVWSKKTLCYITQISLLRKSQSSESERFYEIF